MNPAPQSAAHDYGDLSLDALTVAECLLIISTRLWKQNVVCKKTCPADWRGGFCAVGLADIADGVVEPLMHILHGNGRLFDIHNVQCRHVTATETNLLHCVALLQHHRLEETEIFLQSILSAPAAKTAFPLAWRLANKLLLARMQLPLRQRQATPRLVAGGSMVH